MHECLEHRWGICQTKGHHYKLKEALMCAEGRLVDILRGHPKIQFGEKAGALEFIQKFIDNRNWKLVLDGDKVETTVVDTETPSPVGLSDE